MTSPFEARLFYHGPSSKHFSSGLARQTARHPWRAAGFESIASCLQADQLQMNDATIVPHSRAVRALVKMLIWNCLFSFPRGSRRPLTCIHPNFRSMFQIYGEVPRYATFMASHSINLTLAFPPLPLGWAPLSRSLSGRVRESSRAVSR